MIDSPQDRFSERPRFDGCRSNVVEPTRLLTVREAAHRLALGRSTLYNLMDRGALPYVKIGRARRIPSGEIERLVRDSLVVRDSGALPA
ncbi:MAG: helix-turn-helix domain-containing protein [Planctomycetales bacterium]